MFITITIIIMAMPMIIIIITIPHYSAAGSRRSQTTSVKVASQGNTRSEIIRAREGNKHTHSDLVTVNRCISNSSTLVTVNRFADRYASLLLRLHKRHPFASQS